MGPRMMSPLIIELRPNEVARREEGNPHVPYSPAEIAEQAGQAADAGATVLHWHARDSVSGDPTHDIEPYLDTMELVRSRSELLLYPTLGYTSATEARTRVAHLVAARDRFGHGADLAPVDFGSVEVDRWNPASQRFEPGDAVYTNTRAAVAEALSILRDLDIPVVAVCWHPGQVRTALRFREAGLLPERVMWQFPFTGALLPAGAGSDLAALQSMRNTIPQGEPWSVLCFQGDVFELASWAITLGGHVALGTGDDPYLRFGAPSNAELVERVTTLAALLGRPVATPEQTREILELS